MCIDELYKHNHYQGRHEQKHFSAVGMHLFFPLLKIISSLCTFCIAGKVHMNNPLGQKRVYIKAWKGTYAIMYKVARGMVIYDHNRRTL